ncbi:translocation and assembly module protein TamB [Rhodobacteraceae bacterium WD3A24]|nr:translocation and assembly module protein TamB [Rhodobacteraceae bacterium WD3A24]
MRRVWRCLATTLVLWCALSVAMPAAAQEDDPGFLAGLLQDQLSDAGRDVRIRGFEGALSSRATIESLTVADGEGVWLTLRDIALDWRRSALLSGRLEVNELSAGEILLDRLPVVEASGPSPEARSLALPELPVSIEIGTLSAQRVRLGAPILGEPAELRLDGSANLAGGEGEASLVAERIDGAEGRLSLEGSYANDTRHLALALELSEGPAGIAASLIGLPGEPALEMSIAGEGILDDFAADISLATAGRERLSGRVTLVSDAADGQAPPEAAAQRFDARLEGDLRPLVPPQYRAFFGPESRLVTSGASYADGRMELSELSLSASALSLGGRVELAAGGLPKLIDLDGRIESPEGGAVALPGAGGTTLRRAALALNFDADRGEDWNADITAREVRSPGMSIETLRLTGSGQIVGPAATGVQPEGARVLAQLVFGAEGLAPDDPALARALGGAVRGTADLDWRQGAPLRLGALTLSGENYGLAANGRIDMRGFDGTVEGQLADLARLSDLAGRPLSGALEGRLEGRFAPLTGAFDGNARLTGRDLAIDQPQADRLLAGRSEIFVSARRDTEGTALRSLTVDARTLDLDAFGQFSSERNALTARLDFSDLAVLGDGYGGALTADAHLSGPAGGHEISLQARAEALSTGIAPLDGLLIRETTLALRGRQDGAGLRVERAALDGAGISARLDGRLEQGASRLEGAVSLADLSRLHPRLSGGLSAQATLSEDGARRRISLDATGEGLAVDDPHADRLLRGRTTLSVRAQAEDGEIRLDRLGLENERLEVSAQSVADADPGAIVQPDLSVSARINDIAVLAPDFSGPVEVSGRISRNGSEYGLDLSGSGPADIALSVQGGLTRDLIADLRLTGRGELAVLGLMLEPTTIEGPAEFDIAVNGPLQLSSVSGRASTSGARIVEPRQNITLENVTASADLAGGRAEVDVAGEVAQGGRFSLSGPITLAPGLPAALEVTAQNARVADPRLYEARLSGRLGIDGPLRDGALISGTLRLQEAELRIPTANFGDNGHVPDGLHHVNESGAARATRDRAGILDGGERRRNGPPFRLDVTLEAPNRIFVRGRGLDAELGGTLQLRGDTADVIPAGEFGLIRGRFDLLGNRFTLNEGFATLQGRFVPVIRLVANTDTGGLTARVIIEGVATEPQIRFESVPELPEEEVVSRLIFGENLTELSPFQAAQLASAIATLSGRGGNGLVDNLRQNFGLDDLDVTAGENGGATLRAGRYITENVYSDIAVDSEGRSEVTINLDISSSVTIRGRATSDGHTGLGLYFERDY